MLSMQTKNKQTDSVLERKKNCKTRKTETERCLNSLDLNARWTLAVKDELA